MSGTSKRNDDERNVTVNEKGNVERVVSYGSLVSPLVPAPHLLLGSVLLPFARRRRPEGTEGEREGE